MQETEQFINTGLKLSSTVISVMAFTHFQKHCPSWVLLCFQWILIRMLQLHLLHKLYWFRTAQLLAAVFQVLSIRFWEDAHNLVLSQKLLNKDTMKSHHWAYSSLQLVSFHSGNFYLHYLLLHCYFKKSISSMASWLLLNTVFLHLNGFWNLITFYHEFFVADVSACARC